MLHFTLVGGTPKYYILWRGTEWHGRRVRLSNPVPELKKQSYIGLREKLVCMSALWKPLFQQSS